MPHKSGMKNYKGSKKQYMESMMDEMMGSKKVKKPKKKGKK